MNLKQLSQHLQLSQTTVSRALNGYPEVNENTRKRVLQAAQSLKYTPNPRAKGLATGRTMAIGHVIPMSSNHEMVNPVFGDFMSGAGETYSEAGYDILLSVVGNRNETDVYRTLKYQGQVDGVIVHGPRMNDARIALLHELEIPFVVHGRASDVDVDYAWVDVNNTRAFDRATRYLIDLGHHRIGLVNGLESMDFAHRRRKGFALALASHGICCDPKLMRSGEMTEVYGYTSATEMLALPNPPTAFLAASMITAIGVRRAISAAGLKLGHDVSVITFDDDLSYLKNDEPLPFFTATRSSVREAGKQSAQMLLDMIEGRDTPRNRLLEADLIIGRSTGPGPTARTPDAIQAL